MAPALQLATRDGEVLPRDEDDNILDIDDQLEACVRNFEESEEATQDARKLSERDRDYYDGKQLTADELAVYRARRQPPLIINYIKRKVDFMCGFERRMRSDPKAYPRNPADETAADAATDALRYVADQNDFDVIRSEVYKNMVVEGFGGVDVTADPQPDGTVKVSIAQIPWDRIFYDAHSRKKDFTDCSYYGIVIWSDVKQAKLDYPDKVDVFETTLNSFSMSDTYDDKPKYSMWCDNRRTRIRIVQIHYKWGDKWMVATYTKAGFLVDPQESPYVDKFGKSAPSLVLQAAYVDRDNNRYGHARDLISPQDELNKRRSKALHLMSTRQTYASRAAVKDVREAKIQLQRPDGHVELQDGVSWGQEVGVIPTSDMAAGQMQLLQHVTGELQASGPNAAMAGKDPRQQSGRAIQAQQQGGAIEIEPIVDDLRQWTRRVYEAVWLRVRQFWTEETWVRVTDDERNIKWVGLNKPVTLGMWLAQQPPEMRQQAMMQAAQSLGLNPQDPGIMETVVATENGVSGLDVDINIEEGPDLTTLQSEQFETLSQLAQSGAPIPMTAIIQASSLRNKDQILEQIEKQQEQQSQGQQQAQQAAQQAEGQKLQNETAKTEADVRNKDADTAKTMQEIQANRLMPMSMGPVMRPVLPRQAAQLQHLNQVNPTPPSVGQIM